MRRQEIIELVESTADSAFAIDSEGLIFAWNQAAAAFFNLSAEEAIGKACGEIIKGADECGPFCSPQCVVLQSVERHHPIRNFDLQMETPQGKRWCNVSVLLAHESGARAPSSIHIVRQIDVRKKLEILVRDFVATETHMPTEEAASLLSVTRAPTREAELTGRELEVLRWLAKGASTAAIAERLHISRTTVNNHVQHILRKLGAHNRLEAIRRAEHAGLIGNSHAR